MVESSELFVLAGGFALLAVLLASLLKGPLVREMVRGRMEFYESVRRKRSRLLSGWFFPGGRDYESTRRREEAWARAFFGWILPFFFLAVSALCVAGGLGVIEIGSTPD